MQIEPWNISNSANPANANNQSIYQNGRVGIGDFTNRTMEAGLHIRPNPES
ncbi:hypothetical protein [Faecalibacter bovis]|uniref:Uncharacterized protein n=1 Tax=Faecalibacter bovis TaxID=2898187 RepID=A0ABX7XAV8_9FLAO|nr:hypothetical protein [Faecalibacter bovis]QTV05020.1 hypothetical protein J9309_09490 [Faecalibacter bovis]